MEFTEKSNGGECAIYASVSGVYGIEYVKFVWKLRAFHSAKSIYNLKFVLIAMIQYIRNIIVNSFPD